MGLINRRKFFFGKYKGEYIEDVIVKDTQYITWCINNVNFFQFSDEELRFYKECEHELIVLRSKAKNYRKKYGN